MPKRPLHTLIWSEKRQGYELRVSGQSEQWFRLGDEAAFSRWLADHTAFAFVGQAGRLSLLKEARLRGTGYWYAYRTQRPRAHQNRKRYLGPTTRVTFAHLEEAAQALSREPSPPSPTSELAAPGITTPGTPAGETEQKTGGSHLPPEDKLGRVVFSAKLSPPRLPVSLVERERLLRELDLVRAHPLTLVSASAGSGKTTLLSAWVAVCLQLHASPAMGQGVTPAFAWLSLDALDNDSNRFWVAAIATLRTCLPTIGETALTLLHTPPISPTFDGTRGPPERAAGGWPGTRPGAG